MRHMAHAAARVWSSGRGRRRRRLRWWKGIVLTKKNVYRDCFSCITSSWDAARYCAVGVRNYSHGNCSRHLEMFTTDRNIIAGRRLCCDVVAWWRFSSGLGRDCGGKWHFRTQLTSEEGKEVRWVPICYPVFARVWSFLSCQDRKKVGK